MSKEKKLDKRKGSDSPKSENYEQSKMKITLTVYQQKIILLLLFIISHVSRMDQLSDVIYDSLRIIEKHRFRPLLSGYYATDFDKNIVYEREESGTSLSGKGLYAFERYLLYFKRLYDDEFITQYLNYGDIIIAILCFRACVDLDARSRLRRQFGYISIVLLDTDQIDILTMSLVHLESLEEDSDTVCLFSEFESSIRTFLAKDILDRKTLSLIDVYEKRRNPDTEEVANMILRMRRENADLGKTGKSVNSSWTRPWRTFNSDED